MSRIYIYSKCFKLDNIEIEAIKDIVELDVSIEINY